MKKLLVTLVLAGTLSVPSVVFAEASWYGSLRGGVASTGGVESYSDGGSRWGIKGSSEVSDGLTAVYRFEHKISTTDAGQSGGGRLAYAGLSGGFGTLTLGQVWSASYNSVGAITDNSFAWGDAETSYRHGNVVSYAVATGNASLQVDVMMDGKATMPKDIDKFEFGLTFGLGDNAKLALAHINMGDSMKEEDIYMSTLSGSVQLMGEPGVTHTLRINQAPLNASQTPLDVSQTPLDASHTLAIGEISASLRQPVTVQGFKLGYAPRKMEPLWLCAPDDGTAGTGGDGTDALNVESDCDPDDVTRTKVYDADGNHAMRSSGVERLARDDSGMLQPEGTGSTVAGSSDSDDIDFSGLTHHQASDGKQLMKRVVWRLLTATNTRTGTSRFVALDDDDATTGENGNDDNCEGTISDTNMELCQQTVQYYYMDGETLTPVLTSGDGAENLVEHRAATHVMVDVEGGQLTGDIDVSGGQVSVTGGQVTVTGGEATLEGDITVDSGTLDVSNGDLAVTTTKQKRTTLVPGFKQSLLAVEANLGGVTAFAGYSQKKMNQTSSNDRTTFLGLRGSVGDTGLGYLLQVRNKEDNTTPVLVGLNKSLGGGASVHFEHSDSDVKGKKANTGVWLKVDF